MPVQGLTNQWARYDGLLARFSAISDDDASGTLVAKHRMIRELPSILVGIAVAHFLSLSVYGKARPTVSGLTHR